MGQYEDYVAKFKAKYGRAPAWNDRVAIAKGVFYSKYGKMPTKAQMQPILGEVRRSLPNAAKLPKGPVVPAPDDPRMTLNIPRPKPVQRVPGIPDSVAAVKPKNAAPRPSWEIPVKVVSPPGLQQRLAREKATAPIPGGSIAENFKRNIAAHIDDSMDALGAIQQVRKADLTLLNPFASKSEKDAARKVIDNPVIGERAMSYGKNAAAAVGLSAASAAAGAAIPLANTIIGGGFAGYGTAKAIMDPKGAKERPFDAVLPFLPLAAEFAGPAIGSAARGAVRGARGAVEDVVGGRAMGKAAATGTGDVVMPGQKPPPSGVGPELERMGARGEAAVVRMAEKMGVSKPDAVNLAELARITKMRPAFSSTPPMANEAIPPTYNPSVASQAATEAAMARLKALPTPPAVASLLAAQAAVAGGAGQVPPPTIAPEPSVDFPFIVPPSATPVDRANARRGALGSRYRDLWERIFQPDGTLRPDAKPDDLTRLTDLYQTITDFDTRHADVEGMRLPEPGSATQAAPQQPKNDGAQAEHDALAAKVLKKDGTPRKNAKAADVARLEELQRKFDAAVNDATANAGVPVVPVAPPAPQGKTPLTKNGPVVIERPNNSGGATRIEFPSQKAADKFLDDERAANAENAKNVTPSPRVGPSPARAASPTGKVSFDYDVEKDDLEAHGLVSGELGDFADDGGDVIRVDGQPVGWLHTDGDGVLDAIEIKPEYRGKGIAQRAVSDYFGGEPFRAFMPSEAGQALNASIGDVTDQGDGYVLVTPRAVSGGRSESKAGASASVPDEGDNVKPLPKVKRREQSGPTTLTPEAPAAPSTSQAVTPPAPQVKAPESKAGQERIPPPSVKHPWEMTREEFIGSGRINAPSKDNPKPRATAATAMAEAHPFMGGKYTIRRGPDEGDTFTVYDGERIVASYDGVNLVVDPKYRRQGIASELVADYRTARPQESLNGSRTAIANDVRAKAHRIIVERAVNDGRIKSHPDYPDISKPAETPAPPSTERKAGESDAGLMARLEANDPGRMTFSDLKAKARFVRYKGGRRLFIEVPDSANAPSFVRDQKNGKLTRPADDILRDYHRFQVEMAVERYEIGQRPGALPHERNAKLPPPEVLADYPDLAERARRLSAPAIPTPKKPEKVAPPKRAETKKADTPEAAPKSKIQQAAAEARERLKKAGLGRLNTGIPFDVMLDLAIVGAAYIENGIVDSRKWAAKMLEEFGDAIKPRLAEIWQASFSAGKKLSPETFTAEATEYKGPKEKAEAEAKDAPKVLSDDTRAAHEAEYKALAARALKKDGTPKKNAAPEDLVRLAELRNIATEDNQRRQREMRERARTRGVQALRDLGYEPGESVETRNPVTGEWETGETRSASNGHITVKMPDGAYEFPQSAVRKPSTARTGAETPAQTTPNAPPVRKKNWEKTENEFVNERLEKEQARYEKAVTAQEAAVAKLREGTRKHTLEYATLQGWKNKLERLRNRDASETAILREEYAKAVKKAISTGEPVPQSIIDQRPEFKKAQTGRQRYEKGRHTSFANKSIAVNDEMQEKTGYKVKRQDGKPITRKQIERIQAAVDVVESALGPLDDIFRKTDLTVSHTSGKFPFMTNDAGGLYHPGDSVISMGIALLDGTEQPVFGHEFAHLLDYAAGAEEAAATPVVRGTRRFNTQALSVADDRAATNRVDRGLIQDARDAIRADQTRIRKLLAQKKDADVPTEQATLAQIVKISLGPYWFQPEEVFARLVEQYIANKAGKRNAATPSPEQLTQYPGWWSQEEFDRFEPRIKEEIDRRLAILRKNAEATEARPSAVTPDPATASPVTVDMFGEAAQATPEPVATAPPPRPPEYPSGMRFHGSSSPVELGFTYDRYQSHNLFGPGFYTTDNPEVALGYTKKGAGKEPSLHTVEWTGKEPPKLLNLDEKPNDDLLDALSTQMSWIDGGGTPEEAAAFRAQLAKKGTGRDAYGSFKELMSDMGLTRADAEDRMDAVLDNLSDKGWNGFEHTGGAGNGPGKVPHNVQIFFAPKDRATGEANLRVSPIAAPKAILPGSKTPEVNPLPPHLQKMVRRMDDEGFGQTTVRDVTPEGYGPVDDVENASPAPMPHYGEPTEAMRLRTSINEGQTLLRGDVSGDKRAAIERSVKKNIQRLRALDPDWDEERRSREFNRQDDEADVARLGRRSESKATASPATDKAGPIDPVSGKPLSEMSVAELETARLTAQIDAQGAEYRAFGGSGAARRYRYLEARALKETGRNAKATMEEIGEILRHLSDEARDALDESAAAWERVGEIDKAVLAAKEREAREARRAAESAQPKPISVEANVEGAIAAGKGKMDPKTGLREGDKQYISEAIQNGVRELDGQRPVSFTLPSTGTTYTFSDTAQANALHSRLTGKPLPGMKKATGTHDKTEAAPRGAGTIGTLADEMEALHGGDAGKAADALQKQYDFFSSHPQEAGGKSMEYLNPVIEDLRLRADYAKTGGKSPIGTRSKERGFAIVPDANVKKVFGAYLKAEYYLLNEPLKPFMTRLGTAARKKMGAAEQARVELRLERMARKHGFRYGTLQDAAMAKESMMRRSHRTLFGDRIGTKKVRGFTHIREDAAKGKPDKNKAGEDFNVFVASMFHYGAAAAEDAAENGGDKAAQLAAAEKARANVLNIAHAEGYDDDLVEEAYDLLAANEDANLQDAFDAGMFSQETYDKWLGGLHLRLLSQNHEDVERIATEMARGGDYHAAAKVLERGKGGTGSGVGKIEKARKRRLTDLRDGIPDWAIMDPILAHTRGTSVLARAMEIRALLVNSMGEWGVTEKVARERNDAAGAAGVKLKDLPYVPWKQDLTPWRHYQSKDGTWKRTRMWKNRWIPREIMKAAQLHADPMRAGGMAAYARGKAFKRSRWAEKNFEGWLDFLEASFDWATQLFKFGILPLDFGSHLTQILGNPPALAANIGMPMWTAIGFGMAGFVHVALRTPEYHRASKVVPGLHMGVSEEFGHVGKPLRSKASRKDKGNAWRVLETPEDLYRAASKAAWDAYGTPDRSYRMGVFLWAKAMGKTDEEAAILTEKGMPNYTLDSNPVLNYLSASNVTPIIKFAAMYIPRAIAESVKHPQRPAALILGPILLINTFSGVSPAERAAVLADKPATERVFTVFLGHDEKGKARSVNVGKYMSVLPNGRLGTGDGLAEDIIRTMALTTTPVAQAPAQYMANQSLYSGAPLSRAPKGTPMFVTEKLGKVVGNVSPSWVPPYGRHAKKVMDAYVGKRDSWTGEKPDMGKTILTELTGIRVQSESPAEVRKSLEYKMDRLDREHGEHMASMRRERKQYERGSKARQAVTERMKRAVAEYDKKHNELARARKATITPTAVRP